MVDEKHPAFGFSDSYSPPMFYASSSQVHFDCMYRGITAVSSRESKLLAGNRIIAQVFLLPIITDDDMIWVYTPKHDIRDEMLVLG